VELTVKMFQQCFNHQIASLVDSYKEDHV